MVIHYCRNHYRNKITALVGGEKENNCTECGRDFKNTTSLYYHIATTHKKLRGLIPEKKNFKMEACHKNSGLRLKPFSKLGKIFVLVVS